MNKLNKQLFAGTTTLVMMAGIVAPMSTFASTKFTDVPEGNWAEDAINYGVEQGYIHGVSDTVFGYGQSIKRQDAAIIIASAVYGSSEAVPEGEATFTDVSSSNYAAKYIAALEEYGIVGDGEGHFNPSATITRAEFAQMIVQAFELEDNGTDAPIYTDVVDGLWYNNAITILSTQFGSVGYEDGTWRPNDLLTREAAAQFIYGVHSELNEDVAEEIAVESATVTDVNKIEVTFNQPVDTEKAEVKLMKDEVNYNVTLEWNEALDTVTLTSVGSAINPDEYTVVVNGLTDEALVTDVVVEEEKATSLQVSTTQVEMTSGASVYFNVYNQYGTVLTDVEVDDAASVVVTESIDNVEFGDVIVSGSTDARGNLVATFPITNADSLVAGDTFTVTGVYEGLTVTSDVVFIEPSNLSSLVFGEVTPLEDSERITVGDQDLVVPYTALDQYDAEYTLDLDMDGITFVSSNANIVDVSSIEVNSDGELTLDAGSQSGTAIITAILADGTTSQFSVTVEDAAYIQSISISEPVDLIAEGENVSLDIVVMDQYGEVIPNDEVTDISFTHDFAINTATGKLEGTASEAGEDFEVVASVDGEEMASVVFDVEEKAVANSISEINFDTLYEVGAVDTITTEDVVVKDQYGREFTPSSVELVEKDTTNTNFSVTSGATISADIAGEKVYTVVVDGSTSAVEDITVTAVASTDIVDYELAPLGTLYNGDGYSVTPTLTGKTATGDTVVLKEGKITTLTSSNEDVAMVSGLSIVGAGDTFTSTTDETVTIKAWDGAGNELGTSDLIVTNTLPELTTIVASDEESVLVSDIFVSEDQYGKEFAEEGTWYFTSTETSETVNVSDATQTLTTTDTGFGVDNGEYAVKFVSKDGSITATTTITVK